MYGTKPSHKEAFLTNLREARKERQAELIRELAAVKIQALVRGFLVRAASNNKLRCDFDELLKNEEGEKLKILPIASNVFQLAVKFMDIYSFKKDVKRLEIYTRYLLASMDSDSIKASYASILLKKELTVQWIQHIKKVLLLACDQLSTLQPEICSENKLISLYLHLLLTFTATNTWRIMHQDHLKPLIPPFKKITANIMSELVSKRIYKSLQAILIHGLCKGKPSLRGPALTTVITLALRPYIDDDSSNHILSLITIHLFSVPAVFHHLVTLAPDSLKMLHSLKIFEKILIFIYEEQNLRIVFNSLEARYALCVLANIIHLAYLERESSLPLHTNHFTFVVSQLLSKCGECVATKQGRLTQWHSLLGWFSQTLDHFINDTMNLVRVQLQLLWCRSILKIMFHSLSAVIESIYGAQKISEINVQTSKPDNHNASIGKKNLIKKALESGLNSAKNSEKSKPVLKFGTPEVDDGCDVCSMYYMATCTLSQLKMDILTGIGYRSDVLQLLWAVLQSLGSQCGLKSFLNLLTISTESSPEFHLLMLFCDASTQLISVLDDIEMYEQKSPFSLEDFKIMSNFLNYFVYKMIKNGLVEDVDQSPVLQSAHTLLKLLYRRNARRQFVPDNHWYITDLHVLILMSDLEKGKLISKVLIQRVPHVLPHEDRVLLFRRLIAKDKGLYGRDNSTNAPSAVITVRRGAIVEDGYRQLASLTSQTLKKIIRVRFVNQQGLDEPGIDQDGVFKEFLEETLHQVFHPGLNLFRVTNEGRLYPSHSSSLTENHLQLFEFTGKMLAKAMYEGILVDCPFASFFLSQVVGEQQSALYSFIDELPSLDAELYKNVTYVKHYEGDVSDLGLTFAYDEDYLGSVVSHELRPGGKAIGVTNESKISYVHLMAHFKLHTQIRDQTKAFVRGFRSIINPEWLTLFSVPELQRIISGDNIVLDLQDLRQHTHYYGGFHPKHRVISWLWDILKNDFTEDERALFLKFVTSCSKPPLLGFSNLEPPFSIRCVEVTDDEDTGDTIGSVLRGFFAIHKRDPVNRLPTASTCFNLLKLPNYQKRSTLREKLRYAIHSNTGFELS